VGSAKAAMEELQKRWLVETIRNVKAPFLGICLGMQLLFDYSEERDVACLGIIKGRVRRFQGKGLKVPQIGWNRVKNEKLKMKSGSYFYFVHSYYCVPEDGGVVTATTEYGVEFASAVQYKNFYGVQFHPEKSGEAGLEVLKNFCEL
ncbi:MAG: imidazole glycerol phosphate synthase, glutamine amidotransferase subunit, partial [Candidatus Jacksonbacteria bacterium RIFCSPHIGHO2_12_FULL_44_12]